MNLGPFPRRPPKAGIVSTAGTFFRSAAPTGAAYQPQTSVWLSTLGYFVPHSKARQGWRIGAFHEAQDQVRIPGRAVLGCKVAMMRVETIIKNCFPSSCLINGTGDNWGSTELRNRLDRMRRSE